MAAGRHGDPRGIAAHEAAIEAYLKDLEAADALVDPAEQAAERKRVEQALAEPESVIFGQSDGRQPGYNVQLTPRGAAGSPRPRRAMW